MRARTVRIPFLALVGVALLGHQALAGGAPKPEADAFADSIGDEAAPAASAGSAKGRLGSARMRKANEVAAEMVKTRMERTRGGDLKLLRKASAADVIVVSGTYDRVQDALKAMDVEHVVIRPGLLDKLDLLATQTLMVNCPGNVSKRAIKKIQSFVKRGGHLVTTDWALARVTQRAFPGTIRHNGIRSKDDVVAVEVHDHNQPLLAGVKLAKDKPRWWLEGASFPIKILDKEKVKVLMSSYEMKKKYGEGAVVVSFRHHDGHVLHMTSHFYLQRSKRVAKSEKQKGSSFAKKSGMTQKDLDALKAKGVDADEVESGDLNSAYSMQQFSTNLLVSKQKDNDKLLKKYNKRMKRAVRLPSKKKGKAASKSKDLRKDFRVKVLEKKGDRARVQDLFGNEGWVPVDALY